MRILIVEDDKELREAVAVRLKKDGYDVELCASGEDAPYYMLQPAYDVILLDRMLPGRDGLSLLKEIREKGILTPVIMVTAMSALNDRVDGLDAGADDYIAKPFAIPELEARIRALLRRPRQMQEEQKLKAGDLELSEKEMMLSCGDCQTSLSKKETELFSMFMKHAGQTLSREQILSRGWGADAFIQDGIIDTYIHYVRRRLIAVNSTAKIKTIHGIGYKFVIEKES